MATLVQRTSITNSSSFLFYGGIAAALLAAAGAIVCLAKKIFQFIQSRKGVVNLPKIERELQEEKKDPKQIKQLGIEPLIALLLANFIMQRDRANALSVD